MKFQLALHPLVRVDLVEASSWYETREAGLGERFEAAARKVLMHLGDDALIHSIRFDDIRRANLRGFPFGVYFTISQSTVIALGVLHGSRETRDALTRRVRIASLDTPNG